MISEEENEYVIAVHKKFREINKLVLKEGESISVAHSALCKVMACHILFLEKKKIPFGSLEETIKEITYLVEEGRK